MVWFGMIWDGMICEGTDGMVPECRANEFFECSPSLPHTLCHGMQWHGKGKDGMVWYGMVW